MVNRSYLLVILKYAAFTTTENAIVDENGEIFKSYSSAMFVYFDKFNWPLVKRNIDLMSDQWHIIYI